MKQKVLEIVPQLCTGCLSCELACSFRHEGEFNPLKSRIQVVNRNEICLGVPSVCMQCVDAPCMAICPTGALRRDAATQAVVVEDSRCIGCRICSLACPFGAMHFHSEKAKAFKCDLCGGDPQCTRVCALGALRYVDREMTGAAVLRSVTDKLATQVDQAKRA